MGHIPKVYAGSDPHISFYKTWSKYSYPQIRYWCHFRKITHISVPDILFIPLACSQVGLTKQQGEERCPFQICCCFASHCYKIGVCGHEEIINRLLKIDFLSTHKKSSAVFQCAFNTNVYWEVYVSECAHTRCLVWFLFF